MVASEAREDVEAALADLRDKAWSTDVAATIARIAHAGATDKIGRPYIEHPKAIAELVESHGEPAQQVAWLHDTVEDTAWTLDDLRAAGAPADVLAGVDAVTKRPGETREQALRRAAADPLGFVVKSADVAHNGSSTRNAQVQDPQLRERLATKYANDRVLLDSLGAPRFHVD